MEDQNLARDYCADIVKEIKNLELVLSSNFDELDVCRECGESSSVCEGLYGANAAARCNECNGVADSDGIGQECDYCGAIMIANNMAHKFDPNFPKAVEMWLAMAGESGDDDYAPSVFDYLNAFCLEFVEIGERHGRGDWEITGAKALRSFGGPTCWITWQGGFTWPGGSSVLVSVVWGGGSFEQRVTSPAVAASFKSAGEL